MNYLYAKGDLITVIGPDADEHYRGFVPGMEKFIGMDMRVDNVYKGNWKMNGIDHWAPSYRLTGGQGYSFRECWLARHFELPKDLFDI